MSKETSRQRVAMLLLLLVTANLVTMVGVFTLRRFHTDPATLLDCPGSRLLGSEWARNPEVVYAIWNIRFPRMVAALLVGGALSIARAAYRNLFRSPLVSPGVPGASSGAGFGAALAIIPGLRPTGLQGIVFLFGLLAVLGAWGVSRMTREDQVLALVLEGIIVSALFSAEVLILKCLADPDKELPAVTFWLVGGLNRVRHADLPALFAPILTCAIVLWLLRWQPNAVTFEGETAKSLGTNVTWLRAGVTVCAIILTAVSVPISGVIDWVGLVVSHATRMLFGPQHRLPIPVSFLLGSLPLIRVGTISRALFDAEIPLRILTTLLSTPFLAWLMVGSRP